MKKYKLSKLQEGVVYYRQPEVRFKRGMGSSFAVVYGALKYAYTHKNAKVAIYCDSSSAAFNMIKKLEDMDHKVKTIHTPQTLSAIIRTGLFGCHKSTIEFKSLHSINDMIGLKFDLAYIDSNDLSSEQNGMLSQIATNYCTVISCE